MSDGTSENGEDLSAAILAGLDFVPHVACDMSKCDAEAAILLKCGECPEGAELFCARHYIMAIAYTKSQSARMKFTDTCQHTNDLSSLLAIRLDTGEELG
jgi:hypothetical protein